MISLNYTWTVISPVSLSKESILKSYTVILEWLTYYYGNYENFELAFILRFNFSLLIVMLCAFVILIYFCLIFLYIFK